MDLLARLAEAVADARRLMERLVAEHAETMAAAARLLANTFRAGGKILIFGNGGSAADAQHIAAEFVNRFQIERPPLAALALTTDTSVLTSIANDYAFAEVFVKQIKALGRPGDVAWGISTSGASLNVILALEEARLLGLRTMALSGGDGGPVAGQAEMAIVVPSRNTPRIQEMHILVGHVLCDLVDYLLYPERFEDS
jgi:D-sedoheptulose 7-phosphate isomerase